MLYILGRENKRGQGSWAWIDSIKDKTALMRDSPPDSDSFDDSFRDPEKAKPKPKKLKAATKMSSQAVFDLKLPEVVITEDSSLSGRCLSSKYFGHGKFLFIHDTGKITRNKEMASSKKVGSRDFVLILTDHESWEQFVTQSATTSRAQYETLTPIKSSDPQLKFKTLIWVDSELVSDISLDCWYDLMELYSNANLNIASYLAPKSSSQNSASFGSKPDTSAVQLDPSLGSGVEDIRDEGFNAISVVAQNSPGSSSFKKQVPENTVLAAGVPGTSSKFNFKKVGASATQFIEDNQSKNTKRSSATVLNLFSKFLKEVHPELPSNILEVEVEKLPDLVSECFMCLQKNEEESLNVSTLKTYYNSLSRILLEKRKVSLKNNPDFEIAKKVVQKQQRISQKNGEIPGKHASNAIPADVLAKCWETGAFGKSNPRALTAAIIVHIQGTFGTRAIDELWQMRNSDLIPAPPRDDGLPAHIAYSERLAKNRTGETGQGAREVVPKMFPDDLRPDRCGVRLYRLYQSKKPAEALKPDFRYFLNCRNITTKSWEDCKVWFAAAPMGHNSIANAVKRQIELTGTDTKALKLSGTSVRKTGIDGSMTSGMPGSYVSILYGQRSLASKLNYMSSNDSTMKASNRVLQNVINGESNAGPSYQQIYEEERSAGSVAVNHPSPVAAPTIESNPDTGTTTAPSVDLNPGTSSNLSANESVVKRKKRKRSKKHRKQLESSSSSSSSSDDSSEDERKYKKKIKKLEKQIQLMKQPQSAAINNPGFTINLNLNPFNNMTGDGGLPQNHGQAQGLIQPSQSHLHTRTVTQTISKSDNRSNNLMIADEFDNN